MATSGKDRQRKYKERLRTLNKKAVALDLSKEAYEILVRNTRKTGKSYAEIIDELLMGIQEHEEILRNIPIETGKELHDILTYFDIFKEKQVDEGIKHARDVFQSLDTGEVMNKHDDATERYFNDLLEHSYDTIFRFNYIENRFDYISTTSSKEMSKTVREMKALGSDVVLAEFIHPEDLQKVLDHYDLSKTTCLDDISPTIEYRGKVGGKDGTYRWISATHKIIRDKDNRPVAVIGIAREISESKELEIELRKLIDKLERKITDYASNLEQTNAALTVLMEKYKEEKKVIENNILFNMKELILPSIGKMKHGRRKDVQKHIDILEANLNRITSSFSTKLTSNYLNLSHQEIQVASYIINGKTSKEIAELMGLAERTIDFYRGRMRKKMGLSNKRKSLRTYLLSLQ